MNDQAKKEILLDQIFSPRGVAVVGASSSQFFTFATMVLLSLKEAGFPNIYPVNPKYTEVHGLPCYPNLQSIPGEVDHVVVSIPAESALTLLDECAVKGVKSVHFFTAGFSESGYMEGAALEKAMLDKAKAGGFRIIGPNCIGLIVPKSRLGISLGTPMDAGPIAFLSQSGGHAQNLPSYTALRGLRFSKIVSYGNALDVDECELLKYFSQDPETEIIAAYIEGVKDGRRFFEALDEAASKKPVIIYKGGRTEAGKRAAHGHTASLTSSVAVFEGLIKQKKTIKVDDIEELIDVLVALRFVNPLPEGTGVGLIGAGGGPSVAASDEMEMAGLNVPRLSQAVQEQLKQSLPLAGSIFVNPIDTPNLTSPEAISETMRVLSKVPDIHMLFYHLGFHPISGWGHSRFSQPSFIESLIKTLKEVRQITSKPVVLALRPPMDLAGTKEFLAVQEALVEAEFPVFHSLRRGAQAMARAIAWNCVFR
ncbi:MAG: CoA-binding protein [Deltaproteobacteria bacterium]|nr:CoA-binding protein [Deltaproteobacteria bacterium]MBW2053003.1 CoA-binding protein [Deltaproteobacteria bacterium]MBW2141638.1 CoA-binding protein [Deltaproteobacteria bacterium]MBW2323132.1 CoA-binding protein [Deltaproteobacteria bacterium]